MVVSFHSDPNDFLLTRHDTLLTTKPKAGPRTVAFQPKTAPSEGDWEKPGIVRELAKSVNEARKDDFSIRAAVALVSGAPDTRSTTGTATSKTPKAHPQVLPPNHKSYGGEGVREVIND